MACNNLNSVKIHFSPEGHSLVSISNNKKNIYFLLDTGSTRSILFLHYPIPQNVEHSKNNNKQIKFSLGKSKFNHTFIQDESICRILKDKSIVGILGIDFLVRYKCIINYKDKIFSWNNSKSYNIQDLKFIYPLWIGIKRIGMPVICMMSSFSSIGCLIDTGSTTNVIASDSLDGFGVESKSYETTNINICGKNLPTRIFNVSFQVANFQSLPIDFKDDFSVISNKSDLYIADMEPYFEGIIGNSFLRRNRWIIDFCNDALYFF